MKDNGFVIDLNRISKKEFREYLRGRDLAEDKDLWDAEHLYTRVIVSWPYDADITVEGYESLGLADALGVDEVVSKAIVDLSQKKSEVLSS